jgi:hypothetical protein
MIAIPSFKCGSINKNNTIFKKSISSLLDALYTTLMIIAFFVTDSLAQLKLPYLSQRARNFLFHSQTLTCLILLSIFPDRYQLVIFFMS